MRSGLGCEVSIMTSHKLLDVFLILLSIGVSSELKKVTPFFVKILEKFESHIPNDGEVKGDIKM